MIPSLLSSATWLFWRPARLYWLSHGESRRALTHESGSKDPLHGITLEMIITTLVQDLGFEELGRRVDIRCFQVDPSVKSSLVFLRRTPWARKQVEELYLKRAAR